MGSSKLHRGLGKSFVKMFGNDKVRAEYEKETTEGGKDTSEVIDLTDEENENSEVVKNSAQPFDEKVEEKVVEEIEKKVAEEKKEEKEIKEEVKAEVKEENNTQTEESNSDSLSSQDEKKDENVNMLRLSLIQPNINQPRQNFDEDLLRELSESIQKYGVVEPIVVRKNGPLYEIIAGERRWRAAKMAGLDKVPVVVKEYDDRTAKEVALIENIQRADLNPIEEALAYQSLIEEYGLTQDEVARRVSKNRSTITNTLRILNLNKEIQEMLKKGQLTQGHARALLAIENEELREKIAHRVVEENLTVREIEKLVRLESLSQYRDEQRAKANTIEMQQLKVLIKDLEKKLKHKFNTKVGIVPKNEETGKIEIEYYSKEDLDRIFVLLNGAGIDTIANNEE